ncbi:MAG: type IV pilin N-terminal domain-containing protein [Candidatus Methanoperedens sp.]|nr:type IV pilin N-terminal domain-containing protein [Candidatus Methanoperedens sp.]
MKQNDDAVSPVIGVVLTVAITVILATVIAAFVFGFSADRPINRPTSAIKVEDLHETIGIADIRIQHAGGDRLVNGSWKLSIVPVGNSPVFRDSSADFSVGDQIITTNLTSGTGNYTVTNNRVYTDGIAGNMTSGGKYDVKIIVYPLKALILDTVVEVR